MHHDNLLKGHQSMFSDIHHCHNGHLKKEKKKKKKKKIIIF